MFPELLTYTPTTSPPTTHIGGVGLTCMTRFLLLSFYEMVLIFEMQLLCPELQFMLANSVHLCQRPVVSTYYTIRRKRVLQKQQFVWIDYWLRRLFDGINMREAPL